jgi:hypothetical protein
MPLDRREGVLVNLADDVVREAMEASSAARRDTSAVSLALRILLSHCLGRWPLIMFWELAGQDHVRPRAGHERSLQRHIGTAQASWGDAGSEVKLGSTWAQTVPPFVTLAAPGGEGGRCNG